MEAWLASSDTCPALAVTHILGLMHTSVPILGPGFHTTQEVPGCRSGLGSLKIWPVNMDRNLPPVRVALFQPTDVISTVACGPHGPQ